MQKPLPKKFKDRFVEYPASELTNSTSDILNAVQVDRLPVIITRHGKPIAFLAEISLLEHFQIGLLEKLEEEGARIATVTRVIRRAGTAAESTSRAKQEPSKTMTVAIPRKAR